MRLDAFAHVEHGGAMTRLYDMIRHDTMHHIKLHSEKRRMAGRTIGQDDRNFAKLEHSGRLW